MKFHITLAVIGYCGLTAIMAQDMYTTAVMLLCICIQLAIYARK
jgi:hypothetical protein